MKTQDVWNEPQNIWKSVASVAGHRLVLRPAARYPNNIYLWLDRLRDILITSYASPSGLLLDCFKCLYQGEAVSTSAFNLWSRSDQTDSKGVALKQLTSFYQMLNEVGEGENWVNPLSCGVRWTNFTINCAYYL